MEIKRGQVKIFKIRNRKGFAAFFANNITEGKTAGEAFERMAKAVRRRAKRG